MSTQHEDLKEMRKDKVNKIVINYSKDKVDRIEVTRQ